MLPPLGRPLPEAVADPKWAAAAAPGNPNRYDEWEAICAAAPGFAPTGRVGMNKVRWSAYLRTLRRGVADRSSASSSGGGGCGGGAKLAEAAKLPESMSWLRFGQGLAFAAGATAERAGVAERLAALLAGLAADSDMLEILNACEKKSAICRPFQDQMFAPA